LRVEVATADGDGPEAAARKARYQGIEDACDRHGVDAVLLGHTLDDQAETVLLGLARGSGARSLAGMAKVRGRYHRPLLGLPRAVVRGAYPELGGYEDGHNEDPRFLRARVRHELLPTLIEVLGPGVPGALARSAELFRADADAVQAWADVLTGRHVGVDDQLVTVDAVALAGIPAAVLARVFRDAAVAAGADAGRLTRVHVSALVALIDGWHGQGAVDLPGAVTAARSSGRVVIARRLPT
jgi:tRNA(Ile)-lysidine synthase